MSWQCEEYQTQIPAFARESYTRLKISFTKEANSILHSVTESELEGKKETIRVNIVCPLISESF